MTSYTFKIANRNVSSQLVEEGYTRTRTEMGVTRCTVKLHKKLYSIGDLLEIYRAQDLLFYGYIDKEYLQKGAYTAYASDELIQLSNEIARADSHYEYTNIEYSLIVKDLLSYYFTGVFDVTNVDTTSLICGHIDLKDKPISECLKILAKRCGFIFWLEAPNIFYFKQKESISSGQAAIYGHNIEVFSVTRDAFIKTKVVIRFQLGGKAAFVERGSGTKTAIVTDDTITTEQEAIDLGDALLAEMQDIQIRGEITLTEPYDFLVPGQTIVIHAPDFGFINETIRIKEVVIDPKKTILTVGKMTAIYEDTLVSFEERIRQLENRGLRWATSCETRTQTAPGCTGPCEVDCQIACEALGTTCVAACQGGVCQTSCQLNQQIVCVTEEQVCGTSGTCQVACEIGHRCENTCQSQCQADCQLECQVTCQVKCQAGCEATCQSSCELGCETSCEVVTCEIGCELACQSTCQTGTCQATCETTCQTGCEVACNETCETTCLVTCQIENLCCGTVGPD